MDFDDINTISVLGAGNMGHGIAEVAALAGYDVVLRDIEEDLVQDGYDSIEWSLNKLAEKDRLSEDEAESALERITPLVDLEDAVSDADVVVEAVPEVMDIKKEVYQDIDEYAPEEAIFATNTSSLSITELSEVTDRPEQFCGMHFFNPPVRMQLVEVISGAHTADETLDAIESLAEAMDKTPVRVRKDSPGFIVNRVLVPLMNEACWAVHEGDADIETVDSTTKYGVGLPMGAFELGDQVGNDVSYHVLDYVNSVLGEAYEPCPLLEEKVEAEELGKKTGKGWYDYDEGGPEIPTDKVDSDLQARLLALMANETAKLIENDVASAADIDEAMKLGAGYPEGPAKMADEAGLASLVERLDELHEEKGAERYEAADYLRERAEVGGFYDQSEGDAVEYENLRIEKPGDGVGKLVLDRPERMNTISPALMEELGDAIEELEADDEVRSVLLVGAGDRAFSAGADVQAVAGSAQPLEAVELSKQGQSTFGKLKECPMPVVAGIDGYALGGGMELATCADIRIASERSELGQPELNLGLLPGWGGTQRLQRIVGEGRAKEIILSAERYDPETMADYGFVNEVVETEDFEERAHEMAADLAAGPPIAQKFTKRAMHAGADDVEAGLEVESAAFGHLIATDDLMEGITAFMSDRDPEFEGE